jgi:CRP-like cAMP-binding protein
MMFEILGNYLRSRIEVSDDQMREVEALCIAHHGKKGDVVLKAGDVCHSTFFIVKGCLRSFVLDKKNKPHVIEFAPENHWLTERISFMTGEPAAFFIDAIEDTEYISVPDTFFAKLPAIVPNAEKFNRELLIDSIKSFRKRLISLLSESGEDRYLAFIESYPSLALRVPQKMIASYLGITPESLSRIRKTLSVPSGNPE